MLEETPVAAQPASSRSEDDSPQRAAGATDESLHQEPHGTESMERHSPKVASNNKDSRGGERMKMTRTEAMKGCGPQHFVPDLDVEYVRHIENDNREAAGQEMELSGKIEALAAKLHTMTTERDELRARLHALASTVQGDDCQAQSENTRIQQPEHEQEEAAAAAASAAEEESQSPKKLSKARQRKADQRKSTAKYNAQRALKQSLIRAATALAKEHQKEEEERVIEYPCKRGEVKDPGVKRIIVYLFDQRPDLMDTICTAFQVSQASVYDWVAAAKAR